MTKTRNFSTPLWSVVVVVLSYALVALYLGVILHFSFLRSDPLDYWNDSLKWTRPYNSFHVPGYPWMIAAARCLTGGQASPVILMTGVNVLALVGSAVLIYQILLHDGVSNHLAALGGLLFGLWPAVGLTYSVYPLADVPAMSLLLGGLWCLQRSRVLPAAVFLGLAMLTHKAMWLFALCLVIAQLLQQGHTNLKQTMAFIAILLLPLGSVWLAGAWHHGSFTWLLERSATTDVASRGSLPVLDGLVGTLLKGGLVALVKGTLALGLASLAAWLLYLAFKLKYQGFPMAIALSVAVLVLFFVLNQHTIWAAVRFSRPLVIPLMLAASTLPALRTPSLRTRLLLAAICCGLLFSQFAFSWYTARRFFA